MTSQTAKMSPLKSKRIDEEQKTVKRMNKYMKDTVKLSKKIITMKKRKEVDPEYTQMRKEINKINQVSWFICAQ